MRLPGPPPLNSEARGAACGHTHGLTEKTLAKYGLTSLTVPALKEYLNDPQSHVRMAATNALRVLFPEEAAQAGLPP